VQRNVEVILAGTTPASVAAKQATSTIPIVMAARPAGDPVALGLAASLGPPGGNVTGMTLQTYALPGKRLELLREAIPRVSRVAIFGNSKLPGATEVKDHEAAAQSLGIRLQPLQVRGSEDSTAHSTPPSRGEPRPW